MKTTQASRDPGGCVTKTWDGAGVQTPGWWASPASAPCFRGAGGPLLAALEEVEAQEQEVYVEALVGTGWMGQVNGGSSKCHGVLC